MVENSESAQAKASQEASQEKKPNRFANIPEYVQKGLKELTRRFGEMFLDQQENTFLLSKMLKDEKVKTALVATGRTLLNIGISIVDVVPGIGEVVSTAADLAKMTEFDLTPDVGKGVAWGSEIFEFVTGGAAPTHVIETTLQLIKDVPRIKEGMVRAKAIWIEHQKVVKSEKVQRAAAVFT